MTLKSFFALPDCLTSFSSTPRYQLVTLCTHRKEELLGKVSHDRGRHVWQPSCHGRAITRALQQLQRHNQLALIKEFTVMPNHVHLLICYQQFHPHLPRWFVKRLREYLTHYCGTWTEAPQPLWDPVVETQLIETDNAKYIVAESLREYAHHWRYDPFHVEKAEKKENRPLYRRGRTKSDRHDE